MKFRARALGSLLHIIQDSHAMGHAVRVGWEDKTNHGAVRYFQDYSEQDSGAHGDFDTPQDGHSIGEHDGSKEEWYGYIPGTPTAFERSKALLVMAKQGCGWSAPRTKSCGQSAADFLKNEVFAEAGKSANDANESSNSHTHPSLQKKVIEKPNSMYQGGG